MQKTREKKVKLTKVIYSTTSEKIFLNFLYFGLLNKGKDSRNQGNPNIFS